MILYHRQLTRADRRWDSDFLTLRALLASPANLLGSIVRLRSHFDCAPNSRTAIESKKWRLASGVPGAGMLFDLGSHLIDQILVLFGTPKTVTCLLFDEGNGKEIREEGFVDNGFLIVIGYEKGLQGRFQALPRPRYCCASLTGTSRAAFDAVRCQR